MRRAYAKGSKGSKGRRGVLLSILVSALPLALALGVLILGSLLFFPGAFGPVGGSVKQALVAALGLVAYVCPVFLGYAVLRSFFGRPEGRIAALAGAAALFLTGEALFSTGAALFSADPLDAGGALGSRLASGLSSFGVFGAFAISFAALLIMLQLAFGVPWLKLAARLADVLADDYRNWQRSRKDLAGQLAAARASGPAAVLESPVVPEAPPEPPQEIAPAERPKEPVKPSIKIPSPAPAGSTYANYKLPPNDLLKAPPAAKDRGKPLENEIQAAILSLELTLKNFGIEARVSGYAPGPVITRYELAPAPGVKVSSIVALENDIALALKAKGIRIIAPIPGKAAVGIEIPNQRPALVVLREIIESPALPPGAPLLSFGLGLSAAGEPLSADLQKMPHLLVAGATNSGKSVMIHSLILSMLFRARPDEVKLLMIDPKRLELTFYDGIPHLFDPTTAAERVAVVTSPKDAAKSLNALVKIMERRYEKFQLFGVRNIDSYNREADKRGSPREFFIVVVIDELADLMLVAQDSVEDSIQRLTQMARAVGIHLVLATQRPSVDVITGVIKANLPCRVAMQVISKIDSKVILDHTGAETLQGKGDMLYLAAGAQKPERCQGAYVGEEEISAVAAYLKTQGKPDYPLLETMAKSAEADLASFGVDPLEFSQALKLVLERRRVSQDLLKSQFGSSARATNLLSALEVKQLIHKPEGSNRWDIHFDAIEDYLRRHFPQVPLDNGK
ncbi:MAG: DNA translocase FtsK 4TM domain-containing protein [Elusimicrobia bacterium]|nr:DNA translocase FtsK 4TM domain-containing protein [Elusimicrobiota bacterium]